jgi:hypothetical protein
MRLRSTRENIQEARLLQQQRPWLGSSRSTVKEKSNAQQRSGRAFDCLRAFADGGCRIDVPKRPFCARETHAAAVDKGYEFARQASKRVPQGLKA